MDEREDDEELEAQVEKVLHIADLRRQVEDLVEGDMIVGDTDQPVPLDTQESFWNHILAMESAEERPLKDILRDRLEFEPKPIDELADETEVSTALWDLIEALADLRHFLSNTDHLSDADLYRLLTERVLEEPESDFPPEMEWNTRHSVDEYGLCADDPDPHAVYLRYYADEGTRAEWAESFPDYEMPPSEVPPYDRDRFLPD